MSLDHYQDIETKGLKYKVFVFYDEFTHEPDNEDWLIEAFETNSYEEAETCAFFLKKSSFALRSSLFIKIKQRIEIEKDNQKETIYKSIQ